MARENVRLATAVTFLFLLVLGLTSNAIYMAWFAGKGPRFTAADGAQERAERIAADAVLSRQIACLEGDKEACKGQ